MGPFYIVAQVESTDPTTVTSVIRRASGGGYRGLGTDVREAMTAASKATTWGLLREAYGSKLAIGCGVGGLTHTWDTESELIVPAEVLG